MTSLRVILLTALVGSASLHDLSADEVEERFDGAQLSGEWDITFEPTPAGIDVSGWDHFVRDGELVVSDVSPERQTFSEIPGRCSVVLSRPFVATGVFQAEMEFSWDSHDRIDAMQGVALRVASEQRVLVDFGYYDAWARKRARKIAFLLDEEIRGPTEEFPLSGSATVRIARDSRGSVDVFWNETFFARAQISEDVSFLQISFSHYPYASAGLAASFGSLAVSSVGAVSSSIPFIRADTTANGRVDIGDAIRILSWLFGDATLDCVAAADVDASGAVDVSDAIGLLGYLFLGTVPPHPPFRECGLSSSPPALGCESYPSCSA